jgi:hypothetical protein
MRLPRPLVLAVVLVPACGTTPGAEPPALLPTAAFEASPTAPVLRLLQLIPEDGARVDATMEITAVLAYHIPHFDPNREYRVAALFAARHGGSFNPTGDGQPIESPVGILTIRQPLAGVIGHGFNEPSPPITGVFYLLDQERGPVQEDTVWVGEFTRIRMGKGRSQARASTRTFFYNGGGPARRLTLCCSVIDLLDEYRSFRPHKAIAMAQDPAGRLAYGYAFGRSTPAEAADGALAQCRTWAEQQGIQAECRLVAVDDAPA